VSEYTKGVFAYTADENMAREIGPTCGQSALPSMEISPFSSCKGSMIGRRPGNLDIFWIRNGKGLEPDMFFGSRVGVSEVTGKSEMKGILESSRKLCEGDILETSPATEQYTMEFDIPFQSEGCTTSDQTVVCKVGEKAIITFQGTYKGQPSEVLQMKHFETNEEAQAPTGEYTVHQEPTLCMRGPNDYVMFESSSLWFSKEVPRLAIGTTEFEAPNSWSEEFYCPKAWPPVDGSSEELKTVTSFSSQTYMFEFNGSKMLKYDVPYEESDNDNWWDNDDVVKWDDDFRNTNSPTTSPTRKATGGSTGGDTGGIFEDPESAAIRKTTGLAVVTLALWCIVSV